MNDNEVTAWQLNDQFYAREVAALVMGFSPHEASDEQIEPLMRCIQRDYGEAIYFHKQQINQTDNRYEKNNLPETALQSNAMIKLVDSENWDPQYNHHDLYFWLDSNSEASGEWRRSKLEEQFFSRVEINRWLKANDIQSNFQFDSTLYRVAIGKSKSEYDPRKTPHRTILMDTIDTASARFWGVNVRSEQPDTHPTNQSVAKWLIDNNLAEKTMANKIATIIRPKWAHKGNPLAS